MKTNDIAPRYTEYPHKVLGGAIVAGRYVRQACQRYMDMLTREDIEFRAEEVDKVERFISKLRHFKGAAARKPFTLSDFQFFAICAIYGLYKDGTRLTRNVYLELARKNGKSAFAAALCLYELICSGEASPEVCLLANSAKQSGYLYDMCRQYAQSIDPRERYSRYYRDSIKFRPTNGILRSFASDATKLDGLSPSLYIVDEYHAAKSSACYDVMKSGQGYRDNPLAIVITTAGLDVNCPCYDMHRTCVDILAGIKTDDSTFALIYTLDEGDDWTEPTTWQKANPNLGVTVKSDFLAEQVASAKNNPSRETEIRTKNFNQWQSATATAWLSADAINKATADIDLADYAGNMAWIGVDLAAVSDLTAVAAIIPYDGKFIAKTWYFLPSETVRTSPNRELYEKWARRGYLTITNGNATDYDEVTKCIMEIGSELNVAKVCYDKWNSTQWAIDATALGLPLEPFSQAIGNFNRPTKEFERLMLSGKVIIDNNPCTRWCFSNVAIKTDHNDNAKPVKGGTKSDKIDGVIAIVQALGGYLQGNNYDFEIV